MTPPWGEPESGKLNFPSSTTRPRKTRFRLLTTLYRAGVATCRDAMKGFRGVLYISFSFSQTSWRN